MDFAQILKETRERMDKAVQHTLHEFTNLHTGKATPAMIEGIAVPIEAYGTSMPLNQIAAITTPDSRSLAVTPWDKNTVGAIEKAIRNAGLGLNPIVRGAGIVVPVPELSGDRRKELVKVASGHAEDGRIAVRQARQHGMDLLKKVKADKTASEDDIKRIEKQIQDETDKHIGLINKALEEKEAELLKV